MCPNNNNFYLKIALATLFGIIVGIIAGIIWPAFFTNAVTLLTIQLITSILVLGFLAEYFIFRTQRNNQLSQNSRYYLRFLLFGSIGSFIISTIALSTTLTSSLLSSIIFGIAVAFFVILIIGVIFIFNNAIRNS
ncbi:MAG: hypothetical protein E7574_01915 [Ruminococcaceae bacterium]|nr:hypothetical protein [Oscillospiraceae bacterium]